MAYQDQKTKTWVGDSRITGTLRRKKRGFKTKREARKWENNRRERILNPEPKMTQLKISKASLAYLEHCKRRGFQINTIRYKAKIYETMIKFWKQDHCIKTINSVLIENFLDSVYDTANGKSANRYNREIKALFNYLQKRQYIDLNPTSPIEAFNEKSFKKYVPPAKDIKKVLDIANKFESDLIRTTFHTAARSGEIRNLKYNDIDLKTNSLTLWTRKRKNGVKEYDNIDMSHSLKKIMVKRMNSCLENNHLWIFPDSKEEQISKSTIDNILPRLCKKADVKQFGMHAIRHHVAMQLAHKNWPLIKIQKFLRHKRATTTDIYLRSLVNIKSTGASILDEIEKDSNFKFDF